MNSFQRTSFLSALLALGLLPAGAASPERVWISPDAAIRDDPDFRIQGEYRGENAGSTMGVQVVALGGGAFDAYVLEGGLPGAGWTPDKSKTLIKGSRSGDKVEFPAAGQKLSGVIRNGNFELTLADGGKQTLSRIERTSPTLGAKPPEGAVVLFDGSDAKQWENAKVENGLLASANSTSIPRFRDYTAHIEFRTPYKPDARGQQRGNSGVYHGGRWETQVLDSFGLSGKDNECGGIYSISPPRLNMCLPPLAWQTYDVEFTAARFDASGTRTAWPRITVRLNGVVIHENVELSKDFTTSAPITGPLKDEGLPLFIQNHKNPVFFRNIWVLPKK